MKTDKINLFENITIYRGNRPSNLSKYTSPIETNNSIPYPTQTDINKVRWTIESCRKFFLTNLGYNFTPSFKGDLLITGSCDIGNIVELKLDKAYIDDKFIRITPNNNINKKFLKYFLTYHKKNILNLGVGSTFKCFYLEPFKKWLINQNIPNIVLQEKIAYFFTLLDKQIDLWVQKLQLLELKYKYYLNRLFTNDLSSLIRFNEYSSNLSVTKLYNISNVLGSGVDKLIKENEKKGKIINFTDVYHNVSLNEKYNLNDVSFTLNEYKKFKVEYNDILITPSSENKTDIGLTSIVYIKNTDCIVYSYHLNLIRLNNIIVFPPYISLQLKTTRIKKYFFNVSQGVTRYTLSKKDFMNIDIFFPDLNEQEKITYFLSKFSILENHIKKIIVKLEQQKKFFINNFFI